MRSMTSKKYPAAMSEITLMWSGDIFASSRDVADECFDCLRHLILLPLSHAPPAA